MLILSMKEENNTQKKPAVVFLHSTNKNKEWLRPLLEVPIICLISPQTILCSCSSKLCKNEAYLLYLVQAYASRGYVAIAIDSRYHGERASNLTTYRDVCILMPCALIMQLFVTGH